MISTASLRAALVTWLKASTPVTDLVNDDIREESYMSDSFTYPSVRVYVVRLSPITVSSNCDTYIAEFTVTFRTAGTTSKPCADGANTLIEAVVGYKPPSPDFVWEVSPFLQSVADPVPESEDEWMSRVFLSARLKET